MDARYFRAAVLAVVVFTAAGASYRTKNFIVNAPSGRLAAEVAQAAEKYRHDLAEEWLGEPMRDWASPLQFSPSRFLILTREHQHC